MGRRLLVWGLVGGIALAAGVAAAQSPPKGPPAANGTAAGSPARGELERLLAIPTTQLATADDLALRRYVGRLGSLRDEVATSEALPPGDLERLDQRLRARGLEVGAILRRRAKEVPPVALPAPQATAGEFPGDLAQLWEGAGRHATLTLVVVGGICLLFLVGMALGQRRGLAMVIRIPSERRGHTSPGLVRAQRGEAGSVDPRGIERDLRRGRSVMLLRSYEIWPERREEYLAFMDRLSAQIYHATGLPCLLWEDRTQPNRFTEALVCSDPAAFHRLNGQELPEVNTLLRAVDGCLRNPGRMEWQILVDRLPGVVPMDGGRRLPWAGPLPVEGRR